MSADPSVDGTMWDRSDVVGSARGVVGLVASAEKSLRPKPTLTEWKVVVMVMSLNGLAVRLKNEGYRLEGVKRQCAALGSVEGQRRHASVREVDG